MLDQQKIAQLREELRRGRTSETSAVVAGDAGNGRSETGTDFQVAGGAIERVSGPRGEPEADTGAAGTDQSGIAAKLERKRSSARRPRKSDGGVDEAGEATERRVGNLATDEPIKERLDTRPKAKLDVPEKKSQHREKSVSSFSDKEAREMTEMLTAKLATYFDMVDAYLHDRQRLKFGKSLEEDVWSNLDEEELAVLVGLWVKWGKRNRYVAESARWTVEVTDYVQVGVLIFPRLQKTVEIMRETYIPLQKKERSHAA
jgi:hypothetical protein